MKQNNQLKLVLASTSPYRKNLLQKLGITFTCISPNIDETPLPNETPSELVLRLAKEKAQAINTTAMRNCLIIGSDQVAVVNNQIIGKPGNTDTAIAQLTMQSGQCVTFFTGLAVHNSKTKQTISEIDTYKVHFKHLTSEEITTYIKKEQPYNCAGSFKSEGLGIALFERLEGRDPNTLIGLPLILLCEMLKSQGFSVLGT